MEADDVVLFSSKNFEVFSSTLLLGRDVQTDSQSSYSWRDAHGSDKEIV